MHGTDIPIAGGMVGVGVVGGIVVGGGVAAGFKSTWIINI